MQTSVLLLRRKVWLYCVPTCTRPLLSDTSLFCPESCTAAIRRHTAKRRAALEARRAELEAAAGGSPAAGAGGAWCEVLQLEVAAVVHKVSSSA